MSPGQLSKVATWLLYGQYWHCGDHCTHASTPGDPEVAAGARTFEKIRNGCMMPGEVRVKSEHSVDQYSKMWLDSSTGPRGQTGTDKPPTSLEATLPTTPPEFQAMMATEAQCGVGMDYHKNIVMHCGEEMAMEVGGVELALNEVLAPENRDEFQKAHNKEITQMTNRRFVRPGDEATKNTMYL